MSLEIDFSFNKTSASFKTATPVIGSVTTKVINKVDEVGAQLLRTTVATANDTLENPLVTNGIKGAVGGVVLSTIGNFVSSPTLISIGDKVTDISLTVAGIGVGYSLFKNRNITDEELETLLTLPTVNTTELE